MSSLLITHTAVCSSFLAFVWDGTGALTIEHPTGTDGGSGWSIPAFSYPHYNKSSLWRDSADASHVCRPVTLTLKFI